MIFGLLAPSVSAKQKVDTSEEIYSQNGLSEKLVYIVDHYVELKGKSFILNNIPELKEKISQDDLKSVKKHLSEINRTLKSIKNLKKEDDKLYYEITDKELEGIFKAEGYEFDLNKAQPIDTGQISIASNGWTYNGVTKVELHWYLLEWHVYLSKTFVANTIGLTISAIAALIAPLLPTGFGWGVAIAIATSVAGIATSHYLARPLAFRLTLSGSVKSWAYQTP